MQVVEDKYKLSEKEVEAFKAFDDEFTKFKLANKKELGKYGDQAKLSAFLLKMRLI